MANQLTQQNQTKKTFSTFLSAPAVKAKVEQTVGRMNAQSFIASITSAVSTNPQLQNCDHQSIISAAFLGESLKLTPSPQMGQYYLVPYNGKAQFQLGYKGYLQLAMRSGQYRKINVEAIKQGELIHFDPLNEEIQVNLIEDPQVRENTPTIGYYAMFEYTNGFRKVMYWSKEKMEQHALKYSQGYASDKRKGNKYTFWSKDFDGMAYKTMLRQLISKWGIMSVDMQKALEGDMATFNADGSKDYIDNQDISSPAYEEQPQQYIEAPQQQTFMDNPMPKPQYDDLVPEYRLKQMDNSFPMEDEFDPMA